jgi:hypothetical protein
MKLNYHNMQTGDMLSFSGAETDISDTGVGNQAGFPK